MNNDFDKHYKELMNLNVRCEKSLKEYINFCILSETTLIKFETQKHHILPKSIFIQYEKEKWNIINLSHYDHYIAHKLLNKAIKNSSIAYAWHILSHMTDNKDKEYDAMIKEVNEYRSRRMGKYQNEVQENGKTNSQINAEAGAKTMSIKGKDGKTIREKATEDMLITLHTIQPSGKTRAKEVGEASRATMMKIQPSGKTKFQEIAEATSITRLKDGTASEHKNPKALKINIYNSEDVLMFETHGTFRKICEKHELPLSQLKKSYQNNGRLILNKYKPRNPDWVQYKSWYAKIIK